MFLKKCKHSLGREPAAFHDISSRDNIILVKPFPGARIKAMKHYVSSDKSQT